MGAFSYNIDFAETEADERRINLTRFPLYFPEKRMFFLEGSEIFSFSSSVSSCLFQPEDRPCMKANRSRSCLGPSCTEKSAIRAWPFSTSRPGNPRGSTAATFLRRGYPEPVRPEQDRLDFYQRQSLRGAQLAGRGGFQLLVIPFPREQEIMLAAWTVYNWNEQQTGRHHGFGFRADYPNDLWNVQTTYAYYGEALDPGLGFMMREGIQTVLCPGRLSAQAERGSAARLVRQFYFSS